MFIRDIVESINNIEEFIGDLDKDNFLKDRLRQSAIVRQLEIIGEAAKNIPGSSREKYQNIPWKEISGFRDVLTHAYFGVDLKKVWNIIKDDIPKLKKEIEKIKID